MTLDNYRVSVKYRLPGEVGDLYTAFEVQTSGGPNVASVMAIQAAHAEGYEHVDVLKVRLQ